MRMRWTNEELTFMTRYCLRHQDAAASLGRHLDLLLATNLGRSDQGAARFGERLGSAVVRWRVVVTEDRGDLHAEWVH